MKSALLGNTGLIVSRLAFGATKPHQFDDDLGAVHLKLAEADIAELDAASPLALVYPCWSIGNLADRPAVEALW